MQTIRKISAETKSTLDARLARMNKRAAKLGCAPWSYEIIGEELVEDESQHGLYHKILEIKLTGETVKLPGEWRLVCRLEHQDSGNIVLGIEDVPERFRTVWRDCDHCGYNRARKDTFVVRKGDEYRQVGRQCIADYLGHTDPDRLISQCDFVASFSEFFEEVERNHDNVIREEFFKVDAVLAMSVAVIRECNGVYISRQKADEIFGVSTADMIRAQMYQHRLKPEDRIEVTKDDERRAKQVREWIETHDASNNYFGNLKVMAVDDYCKDKGFGILASAVASYAREKRLTQDAEAKAKKVNETIGKVGTRHKFGVLKCIGESSFETDWGVTYIFRLEDKDGRLVVWFTSSPKLEEDASYDIVARIKEHSEYKGRKQTVITRPKVTEIEEVETPEVVRKNGFYA